jgi:hypothetical protein
MTHRRWNGRGRTERARLAIATAAALGAMAALVLLGACGKAPAGWSADERAKTRDTCLTEVGTAVELEQARAYCDCFVAKTVDEYPSYADAERLGTDRDGERLGNACAAELGLGQPDAAATADADARDQELIQESPRQYGDWQVEFVPRGPDPDDVDTWQAIAVDAHDAGARLAYVCDATVSCGFVFRAATACDAGDAEPAPFVLLFTLPNGRSVAQTDARCLPNGAWGFAAVEPILERFSGEPDAVKVGLRGDAWDFSLDGAAATGEPAAPPAR